MHVLEIVGNAIVGGMETHVQQLLESLPSVRFRFTLLAPYDSAFTGSIRALGVRVHIAPIKDEVGWRTLQYASAMIANEQVDVVHTHLPNAHALGGLAGRLTGRPVLATVHGRSLTPLDIEVQRLTDTHLAAVCPACFHHALGVGVPAKRLHLLSMGVDTERFRPGPRDTNRLRAELGIGPSEPLVGFVGRLSWEKGPDLFLRTAVGVRARCPTARFVLVGDGPMREELQTSAERFGLVSAVHFAGLRADMPEIYPGFDLLVSSSRSEATPFAVMEALSCGIPVVAFAVGGVPDLIENEVSGWLADEADVEGLAERVTLRLQNVAGRGIAARAARLRALAHAAHRTSMDSAAQALESVALAGSANRATGSMPYADCGTPVLGAAPAVVDLHSHLKQGVLHRSRDLP